MFKYIDIKEEKVKALMIILAIYLGVSVVLGVIKTIRFVVVFYPEQCSRPFIELCPYAYGAGSTWYERMFLPSILVYWVLDLIVDMFVSVIFWISTGKRLGHW